MVVQLTRAMRLACAVLITAAAFIASAVDARADPGLFSTGWTNIVPTGGAENSIYHVHDVLFYKKGSGTAVTGHFDSAGHFYGMATTTGLSTDWTHIVGSRSYRRLSNDTSPMVSDLLFYNKDTGAAAFAWLYERGGDGIRTCLTGNIGAGWTHIVAWAGARVMLYNDRTGETATGRFGCGGFTRSQTQWLSPGWTNVTAVADSRVLFYDTLAGTAATGYVDVGGTFRQQQMYTRAFARGWTHIVGDADGNMLFYAKPASSLATANGYPGAAGVLRADGTFTTTATYQFSRWTDLVGFTASPHIVFFYNGSTGQAATGYLTPSGYTGLQSWG